MDKIDALHDDLCNATLDLVWRQWTAAGLAGLDESKAAVIDPEALLLASLSLGRNDARLFDEILDWLTRNFTLLDIARLRRLSIRAAPAERRLLQAVTRVVMRHGDARNLERLLDGRSDANRGPDAEGKPAEIEPQPLFYSQGGPRTGWVEDDELFAAAGFLRPPAVLRGLSGRPHGSNPACLRFRLRALVGMGARPEVLTYLLTHDWTHGRLIAERTVYGQAPVASYLTALYEARLVERREEGKKALYRLGAGLREAFGELPRFVDWVRVWPALVALVEALRPTQMTEEARWVRVAETLLEHDAALRAEGFGVENGELRGWARRGTEVLATAVSAVVARVKELSG